MKGLINNGILLGKYKRIWFSLFCALFLTFGGYVINCLPLFTGENLNDYTWMQISKEIMGLDNTDDDIDDVFFVDVSHDKELVDYQDEITKEISGNIDITDRNKLIEFLQLLQQSGNYKYLIMDVRFEKNIHSHSDSLLFSMIVNMPKTVIVSHRDIKLADSILVPKSAIADYSSTIVATNFARYEYIRDTVKSVPLYAYSELEGADMKQYGIFATSNGRLCYRSLFLPFSSKKIEMYGSPKQDKMYYQLGSDLLKEDRDISELIKDKIVIVGDMTEDLHDTYIGLRQGSFIIYRALSCLLQGKHFVSLMLMAIMFVIYFLITYVMLTHKSLLERVSFLHNRKSKLLHFIITFFGYSFVMSVICFILFLFYGEVYSVLLASFVFSLIRYYVSYKSYEYEKN